MAYTYNDNNSKFKIVKAAASSLSSVVAVRPSSVDDYHVTRARQHNRVRSVLFTVLSCCCCNSAVVVSVVVVVSTVRLTVRSSTLGRGVVARAALAARQ